MLHGYCNSLLYLGSILSVSATINFPVPFVTVGQYAETLISRYDFKDTLLPSISPSIKPKLITYILDNIIMHTVLYLPEKNTYLMKLYNGSNRTTANTADITVIAQTYANISLFFDTKVESILI